MIPDRTVEKRQFWQDRGLNYSTSVLVIKAIKVTLWAVNHVHSPADSRLHSYGFPKKFTKVLQYMGDNSLEFGPAQTNVYLNVYLFHRSRYIVEETTSC